jgi:hypothetical protein
MHQMQQSCHNTLQSWPQHRPKRLKNQNICPSSHVRTKLYGVLLKKGGQNVEKGHHWRRMPVVLFRHADE